MNADPEVGTILRRKHPRGGRLAGTVWSEQSEYLTAEDAQIELVNGGKVGAGVDLGQIDGADHLAPPWLKDPSLTATASWSTGPTGAIGLEAEGELGVLGHHLR